MKYVLFNKLYFVNLNSCVKNGFVDLKLNVFINSNFLPILSSKKL